MAVVRDSTGLRRQKSRRATEAKCTPEWWAGGPAVAANAPGWDAGLGRNELGRVRGLWEGRVRRGRQERLSVCWAGRGCVLVQGRAGQPACPRMGQGRNTCWVGFGGVGWAAGKAWGVTRSSR